MKRGAAAGVAAAVIMSLALAGAAAAETDTTAPPSSSGSATTGGTDDLTFTVGITGSVDSFNPFNGIVAESFEMWALMYDQMITYSMKDMSPQPGLATKWEQSPDGLTWTFTIRSGVKWSDGQDLTAADIAYTYSRIIDGGPEAITWGSYLANVDSVTAPDATTVVLKLSKPNAVLPLLPIPIIPEHIWKDIPEDQVKSFPNEPGGDVPIVGSGPFTLQEGHAGGQTYVFERNPDYWNGEPAMSKVVFQVYRAEDTQIQALKAGDIDFAEGISALQYKALQGESGITAIQGISPGFDEIAFNVGSVDTKTGQPMGDPNPAVLDPAFRRALSFAVDRDTIVSKAYQGAGEPGGTFIPPIYKDFSWVNPDPNAYKFDPAHAEELLDAAGYTVGSDGWRTMPDGSPIGQLRLFARSDSTSSLDTMDLFHEWLKEIHIDSKIVAVEGNRLTNIILDGDYDIFQWGWYVEPDPDSMLQYFTCGQLDGWNDSWYCNKKYDALYEAQRSATNDDQRFAIVKKMQAMIYEAMPYIVTAYTSIDEAYRSDRWTNFQPQPDPGGILLFQYGATNYINIKPVVEDAAAGGGSGKLSGGDILAIGVVMVLLFLAGGAIGGFAGYRKATVDYRE
ncbi:MAG TPA: ABC transporter substrate-binding protein [Nocardioidaceae bacterium]|nr:ABC transporter substrate-binding protein [Nocardioidaceae bacterium]